MTARSMYDELGGEPVLRGIIDHFVDRVFDDTMIGFFFAKVSRGRVKEKEFEHAAQHLGADIVYSGRPIREAHAKHPIMGGQFQRRLTLLREVLEKYGVQSHIRDHWLRHDESLRAEVTADPDGRCDPILARAKIGGDPAR